jgi:integrase/recombinase XerD
LSAYACQKASWLVRAGLWLHGRSASTRGAYAGDARVFLAHVDKPLRAVTLGDLQGFADSLTGLAPASRACRLSSVKSLPAFGQRAGYLMVNVGAAVRLPSIKNVLAERIVGEADVHRMLALETDPHNAAILRLIYGAGLRISEAAALVWRDLQPRDNAGQITVYGKGGTTRMILLPASLWRSLVQLHGDAGPAVPVFRSAKAGHLDRTQVHRIVKVAVARAGLSPEISAHWLRHAHVSHALDRGAPAHLVQATVGHASLATTSRYAHARPNDSSARYLAL